MTNQAGGQQPRQRTSSNNGGGSKPPTKQGGGGQQTVNGSSGAPPVGNNTPSATWQADFIAGDEFPVNVKALCHAHQFDLDRTPCWRRHKDTEGEFASLLWGGLVIGADPSMGGRWNDWYRSVRDTFSRIVDDLAACSKNGCSLDGPDHVAVNSARLYGTGPKAGTSHAPSVPKNNGGGGGGQQAGPTAKGGGAPLGSPANPKPQTGDSSGVGSKALSINEAWNEVNLRRDSPEGRVIEAKRVAVENRVTARQAETMKRRPDLGADVAMSVAWSEINREVKAEAEAEAKAAIESYDEECGDRVVAEYRATHGGVSPAEFMMKFWETHPQLTAKQMLAVFANGKAFAFRDGGQRSGPVAKGDDGSQPTRPKAQTGGRDEMDRGAAVGEGSPVVPREHAWEDKGEASARYAAMNPTSDGVTNPPHDTSTATVGESHRSAVAQGEAQAPVGVLHLPTGMSQMEEFADAIARGLSRHSPTPPDPRKEEAREEAEKEAARRAELLAKFQDPAKTSVAKLTMMAAYREIDVAVAVAGAPHATDEILIQLSERSDVEVAKAVAATPAALPDEVAVRLAAHPDVEVRRIVAARPHPSLALQQAIVDQDDAEARITLLCEHHPMELDGDILLMADAEQWEGADQAFTEEASEWWHLGHGPHPSLRQAYFEDNPEVFDVFDQNPYYRTTYFTKYPDTAELYYSTRPEMREADQPETPDEPDGSVEPDGEASTGGAAGWLAKLKQKWDETGEGGGPASPDESWRPAPGMPRVQRWGRNRS